MTWLPSSKASPLRMLAIPASIILVTLLVVLVLPLCATVIVDVLELSSMLFLPCQVQDSGESLSEK